jgi:hypothetical protein
MFFKIVYAYHMLKKYMSLLETESDENLFNPICKKFLSKKL